MAPIDSRHAILALIVLVVSLLACGKNEAATSACKAQSSSDDCESCCEAEGASGYAFAGGDCSCLGG